MYWAGVGFLRVECRALGRKDKEGSTSTHLIVTVCSAPGLLFSNTLGKVLLIPTICKGHRHLGFLAGPAGRGWAVIITVYPGVAGEFV